MPQLVKKRRSGWAVLAAGALVASLLAVGVSPVGAVEENADHKAATSACVGDALGDQMFTDVSDAHAFKDAINCIAYYGITNGTGDGSTFSPNDDVTRDEMAVFLARAAGVAGVDLGDAMDAGFDDIGDTWQEAQDAINQLADKGILPKGDSYRPGDGMTRAEMALALIGLLDATGAVDIGDDGSITIGKEGSSDDHFADARALSPAAVDRASAALFEMGVTNGSGRAAVVDPKKTPLDTNFDPNSTVSRGEMAAFITRALAHTSARPEGVTAQADGNKVVVSVRDENYAAVTNVYVEVFWVETADADAALDDGECGPLPASTEGMHECEIDGADLITGGDGDATTQAIAVPDDGVVAWAWTGEIGDEVEDGTALYRLAMSKAPAEAKVSTTAAISNDLAGTIGKIGSAVTVTLQLQDADGDVTGGAHDKDEPAEWVVYVHTFRHAGGSNIGPAVLVSTLQLKSDADGKATFVLASPPDQNPDTPGDGFRVEYDIRSRCDAVGTPPNAFGNCKAPAADTGTFPGTLPDATVTDGNAETSDDHEGGVTFTDATASASKIEIETSSYVVVAGRTGRTALNRATVKVTDQFGDPVRNAKVTLTSDRGQGDGTNEESSLVDSPANANAGADTADDATDDANNGREFTTGSDGSYTFGYTWSGNGAVETLTARTTAITAADGTALTAAEAANIVTKSVNWAQEAPDGDVTAAAIVGGDVDANQVVFLVSGVPTYVIYDDDDRYNTNAGGVDTDVFANMAAFEKMLSAALAQGGPTTEIEATDYSSRPRHTTEFTIDNTTS